MTMYNTLFGGIYNNKKVLVTGSTGFKGSWLCTWLTLLGARVYGIASDIPTEPSMFETLGLSGRITNHTEDIRDYGRLGAVINETRPDFIFHLAAQSIVSKSYQDPLETLSTNVMGTANVLEAMRNYSLPCTVVIITSDKCYDNYEDLEMDNDAQYFCAGIMVLNLDYLREHHIAERALEFLLEYPEKCFLNEQDALNHVINGNFFALEPKWNTNISDNICFFSNYTASQLKEGQETPSIIHTKGWNYLISSSRNGKLYWKYRKNTPWPKKEFADKNIRRVILKRQLSLLNILYSIWFKFVNRHDKTLCKAPFGLVQYYPLFGTVRVKQ